MATNPSNLYVSQDNTNPPNQQNTQPKVKRDKTPEQIAKEEEQKKACEARGGLWLDGKCVVKESVKLGNKIETLPEEDTTNMPETELAQPEVITDEKGNITGVVLPNGQAYTNLSKEDANAILSKYNPNSTQGATGQGQGQGGFQRSGTAQNIAQEQAQAQQLAGTIGQLGQPLGVSPTGLDVGEAATVGVINAIPRALSYAAAGAAAGAAGGAVFGGVGAAPGAVIGAVGGFISGIASSMISNFKSQRTDTTTAQQRVLDEGKQNLNDWATLAATDPTNRALYVKNFNQQLALIDQAYRQMKLDTSRDVAKFETALPNLAEFEAFYSTQGERDFLVARMTNSLGVQQDPDYMFQLAELQYRRKENV